MLLVFFLGGTTHAAVQQMTVVGVGVHKKIEIAEQMAVEYAKKRAVYLLASKWDVPNLAERLEKLPQKVFNQAIRGAEVRKRARREDTLYVDVAVSIQDVPLRRALGLAVEEAKETETQRGILVIPVFIDGEDARVWGDANPLIAPLKTAVLRHSKGSVVIPAGDREDRARVDYDNVLKVNFDALKVLAKRYGAEEILVAIVTPSAPGSAIATQILMNRLLPTESRPEMIELKTNPSDDEPTRLSATADAIARYAMVISKSVAEAERNAWMKLPSQQVQINFTTMQEYGKLETALRAAPSVARLELPTITLQRVEGVMYLDGSPKKLRRYLEKQAIRVQDVGDRWILSYR